MTQKKNFDTKFMVELALMIAIIIIMSLTPLGYIRTPGLSITLLTVPVAVGAAWTDRWCDLRTGIWSDKLLYGTDR